MSNEKKSRLDLDFSEISGKTEDPVPKADISRLAVPKRKKIVSKREEDPFEQKLVDEDFILDFYDNKIGERRKISLLTCTSKEFQSWYHEMWPVGDSSVKDFDSIRNRKAAFKYIYRFNVSWNNISLNRKNIIWN